MTLKLHTKVSFSKHIEKIVKFNKLSYIEAICEYVESNNMDIEKIGKLLSQSIKDKIYEEAVSKNFYKGKKNNPLPFLVEKE